jgi:ferredoxin
MRRGFERRRPRRSSTDHILADIGKCKACWACIDECRCGALGKIDLWFHRHVVVRHAEKCTGCRRCVNVCPNGVFEPVKRAPAAAASGDA